jgi:hypothetical protein
MRTPAFVAKRANIDAGQCAALGRRSTTMLNRADECRQRADECRRNAAQIADDVLRGTYLDLARRWRMMAHQAESLEQKKERQKKQADWL